MSAVTAGPFAVDAVVLDIEGTVGSLAHVQEVLFPYARERLAHWTAEHWDDPRHAGIRREIREATGDPALGAAAAAAVLGDWSDQDLKTAPLKAVQALIWADGYADGSLHGHVYPEVPGVLADWQQAGIARYVYSSGALAAQRDWFAHSDLGDLSALLDGYFDLTTAGGKREPDSYRRIAAAVGAEGRSVLFLSDVDAELDAAAAAGWRTAGVRRAGDPRGTAVGAHPTVDSLHLLRVTSTR
ncbi:acireductone synthase [Kitasatospora viridis]|uniref:Enolase-phosphatase E1 n=1 Tax=Kitasatospora viridis TaxID=281105 RepID=A0A561UCP6_9ACTN|nr:acireductone synthase [Kitasatospora viridis]TWF97153.1 acireductone synthase [Kitasatospora viridis]